MKVYSCVALHEVKDMKLMISQLDIGNRDLNAKK